MKKMKDKQKERKFEKYPDIVSIEGTKIILEQMKKCICKIIKKDGSIGTGFFCNIKNDNTIIKVMITNNHIINEEYINDNNEIRISLNNDKEFKEIILNNERIIYTNIEYDTTIIEIKDKDGINNFMELDDNYYNNYKNKSIYIIQYGSEKKIGVSYGIINDIDNYNIEYYCNIEEGSSGAPILNLLNNKIIGINKEERKINRGILIKYIINDFINKKLRNEIEMIVKIDKEEINKEIYFLDNIDYIDDNKIKHYHDNLKELNKLNVDLYINEKKYEYEKYFIPKEEGEYKIKLKFKKEIKDCSFMFGGCKNIININFKYFKTKNIIKMKYMFTGCINLINLD